MNPGTAALSRGLDRLVAPAEPEAAAAIGMTFSSPHLA